MIELDDKKIKNILLSENYLTKEDLKKCEQIAETYSLSLIDALMSEGLATRELLGQAMAEYFDVPFIDINKEKIDQKLLLDILVIVRNGPLPSDWLHVAEFKLK